MINSKISRIDRAVADNINDIQRSFGNHSGIVQDFIVFISSRLKTDLFGYTRFTLQDFCEFTGRNRQDLALIHPDFSMGNCKPPIIQSYAFNTIMDFALYTMMEKNIIFSSQYEVKGNGKVVQMHSFPILKDLKVNFNRRVNEQKIYDVRLSEDLLYGFLYRYYTVNTDSYKKVGKGRGGEGRKRLLIYLSKLNHVLQTLNNTNRTSVPVDRLCHLAEIHDKKPSHKKQNLTRTLQFLRNEGQLSFEFSYGDAYKNDGYIVHLCFASSAFPLKELQKEHTFYSRLLEDLKVVYDTQAQKVNDFTERDGFQSWIANQQVDIQLKAQVLIKANYAAFGKQLSRGEAVNLVINNQLSYGCIAVG